MVLQTLLSIQTSRKKGVFVFEMNNKQVEIDGGDEIRKILHGSGFMNPHLKRLEEVASKMRQVEWNMMRRADARSKSETAASYPVAS